MSIEPPMAGVSAAAPADTGSLVTITYYTDPLCSWSWALEPQWRRLRSEYAGWLTWRYRMGGMIPDWGRFTDPLNAVGNPTQMGPHWYQVGALSGMPINAHLWHDDPPSSSYPACVAVKAAEWQGAAAAEQYLRQLREAALLEGRNIARWETLIAIADEMDAGRTGRCGGLDTARFRTDLARPETVEAFRQDLKDASYRGISRFPSLIIQGADRTGVIVVGYRPYALLCEALAHVAPDLPPPQRTTGIAAYVAHWGGATAREVAEAFEIDAPQARAALDDAVAAGTLTRSLLTSNAVIYRRYDPNAR